MKRKPNPARKPARPVGAIELRRRAEAELLAVAKHGKQRPMMAELYRRAEARLRQRQQNSKAKTLVPKSTVAVQRQFHELQVHQVELEMQNTELQETRNRMEVLLEKYTDLYDFAPVGYLTLAPDGTVLLTNLTGAHLVGLERSRVVGRAFGMLISAERRPAFNSFLKQVFADPAKRRGDFDLWIKGQPLRSVNIEAQRSPNGESCRVVVVDITERERTEEKVRVSEIRYRRLFEAAHDGVLLLDPGTCKITDANPFMTQLLGYPRAELIGKELFEIGLLKDEAASQEMFQELKRKREVRYENLPLESKGGRHQEVEVVANLYQENNRAVIQCNIRDITERKQVEQALRASEERYRILFDLGPVAVYSCDVSGVILQFNQRAAELWHRKPAVGDTDERFCGSFKLFRPDGSFMPHEQCPMARVLSGKIAAVRDAEVVIERTDSSRITVIVNICPLKNQRGKIIGAINCFYDITERKRAEEAQRRFAVLAASNRKLEQEIVRRQAVEESLRQSEQHQVRLLAQSLRMQEQLRHLSRQVLRAQEEERKRISRELHDVIAQTLAGINVRLATLKKEAGRDTRGFAGAITHTQRLVEEAVNTVHQFARELRPAVLDDLGVIPALHTFMKHFTERTGVRTHLTAFAGVEQLDPARRTVLFRVAQEALTNVARHAQASRVEVTIQKLSHGIGLKIKDDGKSFRVERAFHANGGNRLGLLGMRERVEMVGGSFEVASAPGQGTTVEAQIPLGKSARGGGNP